MVLTTLRNTDDPGSPGMYCRKCSADLADVADGHCPKCGHRFKPDVTLTYSQWPFDPKAFDRSLRTQTIAWRLLLTIGLIAAVVGAILFGAAAYMME